MLNGPLLLNVPRISGHGSFQLQLLRVTNALQSIFPQQLSATAFIDRSVNKLPEFDLQRITQYGINTQRGAISC